MKLIYDLLKNNKVVTLPVNNSTSLSGFSYNPQTEVLTVLFKRGDIYKYNGVQKEVIYKIAELYYANESMGKTLRKYIIGNYNFTRLASDGNIRYQGV